MAENGSGASLCLPGARPVYNMFFTLIQKESGAAGSVFEAQRDDHLHHGQEAAQPGHLTEGLRRNGRS